MLPNRNYGIRIFGLIEIGIGLVTFFVVIASLILGKSTKPLEVLIFVLTTAAISLSLGLGVLRMNLHSYHLLLFFATEVILSKALIFAKIITLNGALETSIPSQVKNTISVLYHILLIGYFISPKVRKAFGEKRKVLFSIKFTLK